MRGGRWGIEGPPEEAYFRVTNPERFQPLHDAATELLDRLEREFAVERLEGRDADDELGRQSLARPPIRLTPHDRRPHRSWWLSLSFQGCMSGSALGAQRHFPIVAATPATKRPTGCLRR